MKAYQMFMQAYLRWEDQLEFAKSLQQQLGAADLPIHLAQMPT